MTDHIERRQHTRISFDSSALLSGPHGELEARLLDICLRGALLEVGDDWQGDAEARFNLQLELSPTAVVTMEVVLCHRRGPAAGFRCERIDLDSLGHLRRLAELNLADPQLLQRELGELFLER